MSEFDNIGKLMYLPVIDIKLEEKSAEADFLITAAAAAVKETGGRNWVPVIVTEITDYQYQVVSNHFVYAVAQKAELERVWCIVIKPNEKDVEQAKILSRETLPKVNLSTAPKETIAAALKFLVQEPGSVLSKLDVAKTVDKIVANRESWVNIAVITTLKCGISKGDKFKAFSKVFFVSPPKQSEPTPQAPEITSIKRASREEIFSRLSYLSKYKIGGFEAIDPDQAADVIFTASKSKWKSLNPITKLECGIDTAKIKTLKTVFSL